MNSVNELIGLPIWTRLTAGGAHSPRIINAGGKPKLTYLDPQNRMHSIDLPGDVPFGAPIAISAPHGASAADQFLSMGKR